MTFNLEPYNHYILYGALILLVIALIITAGKALGLLKTVGTFSAQAQTAAKKAEKLKAAMEPKEPKKQLITPNTIKVGLIILPALVSIIRQMEQAKKEKDEGKKIGMRRKTVRMLKVGSEQAKIYDALGKLR